MSARATTTKAPKPSKPPKAWQRTEAGRHRSADERFTLESDGAGRWFATDAEALDELGLARTTGPFPTLEAAKAAADEARSRPADASPLAERLAAAKDRPRPPTPLARSGRRRNADQAGGAERSEKAPRRTDQRTIEPVPPPRTWLDELADRDAAAADRARSMIRSLEREGIGEAEALVRRDLLGDRPAVATRLLARDVLVAIAGLRDPNPVTLAQAVAGVLASSPARAGLPGWELVERDASATRNRPIRLTPADLLAAAEDVTGTGD